MFHKHTAVKAAILTLLVSSALPSGLAQAASYLDAEGSHLKRGDRTSYSAALSDFTMDGVVNTTRTLDWRQPTLQLWFDLPASERTSKIRLKLSADPLTRVPGHAPLSVQFNSDAPVPVLSNGRGFEAELSFDPAKARPRRNSLRITFPAPTGADCVSPAHGKWSVDLAASTLSIDGRASARNMSLADLEARLSQAAYAPKKIGLIAFGADATDMQALAAQGLSLRTPDVPKFSVTDQGNDLTVLMVTRDRLFDYTDDPMILNSKGPRVFIPKGQPTQLIFTAKTDAEILKTLRLFSTRHLPNARRPITSPGEIDMQSRLDHDTITLDRHTSLSSLQTASSFTDYGTDSRGSGEKTYRFGVSDPAATAGELLLRLSSSADMAETSRLRVALNGEPLGAARLDRARKSVIFDIDPGQFDATSNVLSLLPELEAKPGYSCPSAQSSGPNLRIGDGSRLSLKSSAPSPQTDLSRVAADGGLFATAQSDIALPRQTRDFEASLRVLGRLAKSAGHGLTLADYSRTHDKALGPDRHLLVIGPSETQLDALGALDNAPKALRDALGGQPATGDDLLRAELERFASADDENFALKYAAAQTAPRRIERGGVAALYSASGNRLIGVIGSTPGESFISTSQALIEPDHWNALEGGVARWNGNTVVMAQTAQVAPGLAPPRLGGLSWSGLNVSTLELPHFETPDWSLPTISRPDWKLPRLIRSNFGRDTAVASLADATARPHTGLRRNLTHSVMTTPELGSSAPVQTVAAPPPQDRKGLRGRFEFEAPDMPRFTTPTFDLPRIGTFTDLRRETKTKWLSARRWSQAKLDRVMTMRSLKDIKRKADRFQNKVEPSGQQLRQTFLDRLPGKGVVQFADRNYSVFGILLILSFISVVFLMSMASPNSRLGGRH